MSPTSRPRFAMPAERLYPQLTGAYAFLSHLVLAVNLVYQTETAQLNPLQLVLVGTITEATRLLFEVPTGVVADFRSRKLSVIIGLLLVGSGYMWVSAYANFFMIAAAHIPVAIGLTFISGAKEAWVADEVGVDAVGAVYMRSVQWDQYGRLAGIPAGVALGLVGLRWPIMLGGALMLVLAAVLRETMTEHGFRPAPDADQVTPRRVLSDFQRAARDVRGRPLLVTLLVMLAFYGAASEGFGRLWIAHFYANVGFPDIRGIEPVIWFGALRMAVSVASLFAIRPLRQMVDTTKQQALSRAVLVINTLQIGSLVVLALSGNFYLAAVSYCAAVVLSRLFDPLYLAWVNQNVESRVRATVISMSSQMNALGQIGGGPVIGAIGALSSLRLALLAAAASMTPTIALVLRAMGQRQELPPGRLEAVGD